MEGIVKNQIKFCFGILETEEKNSKNFLHQHRQIAQKKSGQSFLIGWRSVII